MDVEVARVLALGLAGGDRTQRCAAEESHFDIAREAMDAEEPALALDSVQRRVPFDCLAHARDGAHDERVEAAPDVAFPARHGRDVGLHGYVAVALRGLRVAACEEGRFRGGPFGGSLRCDLSRILGRLAGHCVHSRTAVTSISKGTFGGISAMPMEVRIMFISVRLAISDPGLCYFNNQASLTNEQKPASVGGLPMITGEHDWIIAL